MPLKKDYLREILLSLISVCIFSVVAMLTFYMFGEHNHLYRGSYDAKGSVYYVFSFFWLLFIHDTYFYWIHRLMHTDFLYRHIHRTHHASTNPSPWTAYAFHPLEAILEAGILPIAAFTLPIHFSVIVIFFIFQVIYNVYGHLGFELYPRGFAKTTLGRYVNTSVAHNLHHSHFNGNYGLYLLVWDRLMGTIRTDYQQVYSRVTERN